MAANIAAMSRATDMVRVSACTSVMDAEASGIVAIIAIDR